MKKGETRTDIPGMGDRENKARIDAQSFWYNKERGTSNEDEDNVDIY